MIALYIASWARFKLGISRYVLDCITGNSLKPLVKPMFAMVNLSPYGEFNHTPGRPGFMA
jgi:hypothetical protein